MTGLHDHHAVEAGLDWPGLIETLRKGFAGASIEAPARQVMTIAQPDGQFASLLTMPAWQAGRANGVKVVTFFPGNAAAGKATINAGYLLFDGGDGRRCADRPADGGGLGAVRARCGGSGTDDPGRGGA